MTRLAQRAQSVSLGYFGGYIGKAQPTGQLEMQKCIKKLESLREKLQGKTRQQELRNVSGRAITDLEMCSTLRGAVEVHNLCRNLNHRDVLFAECIRTFTEHTLLGREWMNYLEELTGAKNEALQQPHAEYIFPTPKLAKRSAGSKVNEYYAYGLRPLVHPWKWLSAYEFLKYWRCVPLLDPQQYASRGQTPRTKWTPAGEELAHSTHYKEAQSKKSIAVPGKHFVAVEPLPGAQYALFPPNRVGVFHTHHVNDADMEHFRNSWVLERKQRPDVVVIEGLVMPARHQSTQYNSKYCSLFFRPWTLFPGNVEIPHLSLLAIPRVPLQAFYASYFQEINAQPEVLATTLQESMDWSVAWSTYVRGNVVSESAAQLIRNFLLNTMFSGSPSGEDGDDEHTRTLYSDSVPRLQLSTATFQSELLKIRSCAQKLMEAAQSQMNQKKRNTYATSYDRSKYICEGMWKVVPNANAADERVSPGEMYADTFEEHLHALTVKEAIVKKKYSPLQPPMPAAAEFTPAVQVHQGLDAVLSTILRGQRREGGEVVTPNAEQSAFLRHFTQRLQLEAGEQRAGKINTARAEPLLDCVHGPPGTGFSKYKSISRDMQCK